MLALASVALFMVKRRHALLPIIFIAMFVTTAQRFVIGELDFPFLRVLIMLGWIRVFVLGETRRFKMIALDWFTIYWGVGFFIANSIRDGLVIYSCGWMIDNLGAYFLFRILLRSREEMYESIKYAALLAIPVAAAFVFEKVTRYNMFSVFGGVNEITWLRQGKLRCMGSFSHPILAGCFFAGLLPLIGTLWKKSTESKRGRMLCAAGMVSAMTVVICCASSTPLMAAVAGICALVLFAQHKSVPLLRYATLFGLFVLHFFVMEKPVWHLIARIDLTGGSTGYHRYRLIQATIDRFSEWWLIGTTDTAHWGHHLFDTTGHFVNQCTDGGLFSFLMFCGMLFFAFRAVGRVIKYSPEPADKWLVWTVGAGLFANCVAFIGVSYFGKPLLLFLIQMAMLGSLEVAAKRDRYLVLATARRPLRRAASAKLGTTN